MSKVTCFSNKVNLACIFFAAMTALSCVLVGCDNTGGGDDNSTEPATYTVSFDSQGGSTVESVTVINGNPVRRPKTPAREGYFLVGWFRDSAAGQEWDFDTDRVTSDITLYAHWQEVNSEEGGSGSGGSDGVLVVYFSCSNRTRGVAEYVAVATGGDLVEITPEVAYTAADLNYNNSSSRSQTERREDARPYISNVTYNSIDMSVYQNVFIGYPIWNGYEPMIIRTFIEHYNGFANKTVYTFSTSSSSGGSAANSSVVGRLSDTAVAGGNLHTTSSQLSSAESRVNDWIGGLGLTASKESVENMKVKMTVNSSELFITLTDNSATRDLVSRLKNGVMTLSFSDFGGAEKIAYPTPRLDVSEASGCDPNVGDLTIYTPWENLAAFYRDTSGYSHSLVLIGHIDGNGIELLEREREDFTATLQLVV